MEESSFTSLPGTSWDLVDAQDRAELARVGRAIDALAADPKSNTPEDIALQMSGLAARILAAVAGDERDLRDMIQNLRTCLAVTWDMYDKIQADRTTVSEHIENLREQIQGFEAELTALQLEGEAPPRE
jgi:hypothetical protein